MKTVIAILCLLCLSCTEETIQYVEIPPEVPPVLVVSYNGFNQIESTGGGLFVFYSFGTVRNESEVACSVRAGVTVYEDTGDSVLTSWGVIGYGRPLDIFAGLLDTVETIAAGDTALYFVKTQQFIGSGCLAENVFEVTEAP